MHHKMPFWSQSVVLFVLFVVIRSTRPLLFYFYFFIISSVLKITFFPLKKVDMLRRLLRCDQIFLINAVNNTTSRVSE